MSSSGPSGAAGDAVEGVEGGAISCFSFNPKYSDWLATGYAGNASIQVWTLGSDLAKPTGDEVKLLSTLFSSTDA